METDEFATKIEIKFSKKSRSVKLCTKLEVSLRPDPGHVVCSCDVRQRVSYETLPLFLENNHKIWAMTKAFSRKCNDSCV